MGLLLHAGARCPGNAAGKDASPAFGVIHRMPDTSTADAVQNPPVFLTGVFTSATH
jgi:hypothetical protein